MNSDTEDAVLAFLSGQVTKIFDLVNQNLRRLDNGGYKVIFNGTIQRFENSDVKIEKTYVDRTDGNKTKTFDSSDMFSHTFTFQEAVEKMPGRCEPIITDDPCSTRHDVHVRMMAILGSEITKPPHAAAEVSSSFDLKSHLKCIFRKTTFPKTLRPLIF